MMDLVLSISERDSGWKDKFAVALDALREHRYEISEQMFDELDDEHPRWMFELPWRDRSRDRIPLPIAVMPDVHHPMEPEYTVKKLIATMLVWANEHRSMGLGYGKVRREIAEAFGITPEILRHWVSDGYRDLQRVDRGKPHVTLEEDCDPPEVRRRRRALLLGIRLDER